MIHEILSVLRGLLRAPAFALSVVLPLGLGMGATVTLYSVLDRLFFSPPEHITQPEQVHRVLVHGQNVFTQRVGYSESLTYPDYMDFVRVSSFNGVAAWSARQLTADVGGTSSHVRAELASANYFRVLGALPHLGRFYSEDEDRVEGGTPVAVLSYGYWHRAFGGSSEVLGRDLRLGSGVYTVIGIAPRGFTGVDIAPVDVWVPLRTAGAIESGKFWETSRRWWWLRGVARIDPDRLAAVESEATASYLRGRANAPGYDQDARIVLSPLLKARGPLASRESQVARLLGALAVLVLLIACANVANLILARGTRRRRDLAIQTALGIARGRMIGVLLLESSVLAAAAGAVAVALTGVLAPSLFRVLMPTVAVATSVTARLVAFTAGIAFSVTLLIGLLPALRCTRFDVIESLRGARESRRNSVMRRGLLFVQALLSAILVVGAGLFLRSLDRARAVDLGVETSTLAVHFELQDGSVFGDEISAVSYRALERIRALPFVRYAAATQIPQFRGLNGLTVMLGADTLSISGRGPYYYAATGDYFATVGLRVVRGRGLEDADDRADAEPVAVVSQSFVDEALPDRDALGTCLLIEPEGDATPCTRIVGVVEDALPSIRAEQPHLNLYLPPHHPGLGYTAAGVVLVSVVESSAATRDAVRATAATTSSEIRMVEVNTLASFLESELRPWRLGATLLTGFGLLAILIAASGLYSILAFDIAQRRFELGVRAALGANRRSLVRAVTLHAFLVCGTGLVTGAAVTTLLARIAGDMLFRVSYFEPTVYLTALVTLGLVTIAAATLPSWRVVRVDPRIALRAD